MIRYLVLAWVCFFALVAYVQRGAIAVPAELIQKDLGIDLHQFTVATSIFFWTYALLQVPAGWLGDYLGGRRAIVLCMLIGSQAMVLLALTEGVELFYLWRGVMGAAQAGLFPASVLVIARWFPPVARAFPNGLLGSAMTLGSLVGAVIAGELLFYLSWRELFLLFSVPGIVGATVFFWWFRDKPEEHPRMSSGELTWIQARPALEGALSQSDVVRRDLRWWLSLILVCGQQFFRAGGNLFFYAWFPLFLMQARGTSLQEAGRYNALPLAGMLIGSALGGRIQDWLLRRTGSVAVGRHLFAVVTLSGSALFLVLGFFEKDPLQTVAWLTLAAWGAGVCGPAAYTMTIELAGNKVATVFSIMNMAGNIGAALTPPALLYCQKYFGWDYTLIGLAFIYLAAVGCWVGLYAVAPRRTVS